MRKSNLLLIYAGITHDTLDLRVIYAWYLVQCVMRMIREINARYPDLRKNYARYSWFKHDLRMILGEMRDTHDTRDDTLDLRRIYAWYSWFTRDLRMIPGTMRDTHDMINAWFTHDTPENMLDIRDLRVIYAWYLI